MPACRLRTAAQEDRPNLLGWKATALLLSYAERGTTGFLDQAIDVASAAPGSAPQASPERARFAVTLAQAWSLHASQSGSQEDLDQASAAFRLTATHGQRRAPYTALTAGWQWKFGP